MSRCTNRSVNPFIKRGRIVQLTNILMVLSSLFVPLAHGVIYWRRLYA